jgi:phosphonopyruvate decarboxylase
MLNPRDLLDFLIQNNINFYTGVPDSLLKEFNNTILEKIDKDKHIITANEGSSIALAAGYHLSTKQIPLVYLQNSGTGNIINPLMSLAHKNVYSIPMLIFIGWRGQPGKKDEPQHITQGKCMENLIKSLNIKYDILLNDINLAKEKIKKSITFISKNNCPFIFLVSKNTFSKSNTIYITQNNYEIHRNKALEIIMNNFKNEIFLSTTGKISRELMQLFDNNNLKKDNLFLNVGAMGHVSMISLGVAMNTNKKVLCIDGDGSVIMHMGNLTSVGTSKQKNLIHIVLNNAMHQSVGIQPTLGFDINLTKISKSCGYKFSKCVSNYNDLNYTMKEINEKNISGPIFIEIRINDKTNYYTELPRPKDTPNERKNKFITNILNN